MRLSVVIPTFNEAGNIDALLGELGVPSADPADTEIIFVDDSTDHTPAVIRSAAGRHPVPIVLVRRDEPEGGLGGAVVEGIRRARGEWVVVMDADLQHPPALVPRLPVIGDAADADLVVASRYTSGGSHAGLEGAFRVLVSSGSTLLSKAVFARRLRGISDPMSGFFAIRREAVAPEALRPLGYKILLELVVRTRPSRVIEVPYAFGERRAGDSKSSLKEGLRFLRHLAVLRVDAPRGRTEPALEAS